MSLTVNNLVMQKSETMLMKERLPINSIKTTISCRAKELHVHHKKNLYQVLSLESHNVSSHDLKKAYRAKALELHPDVYPSSKKDECTKRFVELREAYEVLCDPNSRRLYDLSLLGVEDLVSREQKVDFPKTVWEMQLDGLMQGTGIRPKRRSICFV